MQAKMMERDLENHTRWKHQWRWHNRGNVWDKIATEWAGKEDWTGARTMKSTLADEYKFVTFALFVRMPEIHCEESNRGISVTEWIGTGLTWESHMSAARCQPLQCTLDVAEWTLEARIMADVSEDTPGKRPLKEPLQERKVVWGSANARPNFRRAGLLVAGQPVYVTFDRGVFARTHSAHGEFLSTPAGANGSGSTLKK